MARRTCKRRANDSASLLNEENSAITATWSRAGDWWVFDSPSAFASACDSVSAPAWADFPTRWAGGSYDDAARAVRDGDLDAVPEAEARASGINDAVDIAGVRSEWVPEVVGAFANVPSFIAGDPCSMWQRSPIQDERGEITVCACLCASGSITAEELKRRGVCVLAVVLALSRVRSVRLVVYGTSQNMSAAVHLSYPLDISEACAFLGGSCVYRQMFLKLAAVGAAAVGDSYVGIASWSSVLGSSDEEVRRVRAHLCDGGGPALVLTSDRLDRWANATTDDFINRLNAMIQAVNDGAEDLGVV